MSAADNDAVCQLRAYFAGELREFDLKLDLEGTDFQKRVWEAVAEIPFGETRSYGDVARDIGNAGAVRAVGAANAHTTTAAVQACRLLVSVCV